MKRFFRLAAVLSTALFLQFWLFSSLAISGEKTIIPSTGDPLLDKSRALQAAMFCDDFGQLRRYREDDRLVMQQPQQGRVVFFGDSIVDEWKLADYFPDKPYVNRGIMGQTSAQMLLRFRQDVIHLHPAIVVIQATSNDIAGNTGPMQPEDSEANYVSMMELASANGIRVIFASILPVHDYTAQSQAYFPFRPMEKINQINAWASNYCAAKHITFIDYSSAMADKDGLLIQSLSDDGLHPNAAGYRAMAERLGPALRQVAVIP